MSTWVSIIVCLYDELEVTQFDRVREHNGSDRASADQRELIGKLKEHRSSKFRALIKQLEEARLEVRVLGEPWLVLAINVEIQVGDIKKLASFDMVSFIEPNSYRLEEPPKSKGSKPPHGAQDEMKTLALSQKFSKSAHEDSVAILDTGIKTNHVLLKETRTKSLFCLPQTPCSSDKVGDVCDHGTSSAAVIGGWSSDSAYSDYNGMIRIQIVSFRLYKSAPCSYAGVSIAVRALQKAVEMSCATVLIEVDACAPPCSCLARAADWAFACGCCVVAPATWKDGRLNAPANAHCAIGVGPHLIGRDSEGEGKRKYDADCRIKPETTAPTPVKTARSVSETALSDYTGASCASALVAGAACLLKRYLQASGQHSTVEAGDVNTQIILHGSHTFGCGWPPVPSPFCFLGDDGQLKWGRRRVSAGCKWKLSLTVAADSFQSIRCALWWPESWAQSHNRIYLELLDPAAKTAHQSRHPNSIFQKVFEETRKGYLTAGEWHLVVDATEADRDQLVHWASLLHPKPGRICSE